MVSRQQNTPNLSPVPGEPTRRPVSSTEEADTSLDKTYTYQDKPARFRKKPEPAKKPASPAIAINYDFTTVTSVVSPNKVSKTRVKPFMILNSSDQSSTKIEV